jgi:Tocopherol cyclase
MEGYFWRVSEPRSGLVLVALCGVSLGPTGRWTSVALGANADGFLRQAIAPSAWAAPTGLGISAGREAEADEGRLRVELGADARLEVRFAETRMWPPRAFGGLGPAQSIPGLGQYWHPHLLGARAHGAARIGGERIALDGALVYAEKNWGSAFSDHWWWGQAFPDEDACVAFAGGRLRLGPLPAAPTAVVVRAGSELVRLAPPLARMTAATAERSWRIHGRSARHEVLLEGDARHGEPAELPVPVPAERELELRSRQHLAAHLGVTVRRGRRLLYRGESALAGLEHGRQD